MATTHPTGVTRTCATCRGRVSAASAFCPHCGAQQMAGSTAITVNLTWEAAFKVAFAIMVMPVLVVIGLFILMVGAGVAL